MRTVIFLVSLFLAIPNPAFSTTNAIKFIDLNSQLHNEEFIELYASGGNFHNLESGLIFNGGDAAMGPVWFLKNGTKTPISMSDGNFPLKKCPTDIFKINHEQALLRSCDKFYITDGSQENTRE